LKNKRIIYYWASDTRANSGEGILAKLFISDIKKYFKGNKLINLNKDNKNHNKFYNKYILNFFGSLKLWKYYFNGQKTLYINYLPIWNFLTFLILPPKTIIGPITGSLIYKKNSLSNIILRGILLKILKEISLLIIFFRMKKILLSTELLKKTIKKSQLKNVYFNYVLKVFSGFAKKRIKKKIDFLIYYRHHNNKNNSIIDYFIKNTLNKKYKIIVFGDKMLLNNVKNLGYISRNRVRKLLENTKFTFGSSENLYTLFVLDAISKDVVIFYDQNLDNFNNQIKYNKMIPVNFNNKEKLLFFINKKIKNFKIKKNKNFFNKINYKNYFNQWK
jgi:hypothetical protein